MRRFDERRPPAGLGRQRGCQRAGSLEHVLGSAQESPEAALQLDHQHVCKCYERMLAAFADERLSNHRQLAPQGVNGGFQTEERAIRHDLHPTVSRKDIDSRPPVDGVARSLSDHRRRSQQSTDAIARWSC